MVPFKMTVNGVDNILSFPQAYTDLTYGQLLRLKLEYTHRSSNVGLLLEILTGVPRAVWMHQPAEEYNKILSYIQWVATAPKWEELPLPAKLTIKGVDYKIPPNLGFESFGQKIVVEAKIADIMQNALTPPSSEARQELTAEGIKQVAIHKSASSLVAFIPYITAVYMQPRITGKPFDETEIAATEFDILEAGAMEVYPIGSFFIKTILGSIPSGKGRLAPLKARLKRASTTRKRVSKKSKKRRGTS